MSKYYDLSYDETVKVLRENKGKDEELKFNLSQSKRENFDSDEPISKSNLEKELSGP